MFVPFLPFFAWSPVLSGRQHTRGAGASCSAESKAKRRAASKRTRASRKRNR